MLDCMSKQKEMKIVTLIYWLYQVTDAAKFRKSAIIHFNTLFY